MFKLGPLLSSLTWKKIILSDLLDCSPPLTRTLEVDFPLTMALVCKDFRWDLNVSWLFKVCHVKEYNDHILFERHWTFKIFIYKIIIIVISLLKCKGYIDISHFGIGIASITRTWTWYWRLWLNVVFKSLSTNPFINHLTTSIMNSW